MRLLQVFLYDFRNNVNLLFMSRVVNPYHASFLRFAHIELLNVFVKAVEYLMYSIERDFIVTVYLYDFGCGFTFSLEHT